MAKKDVRDFYNKTANQWADQFYADAENLPVLTDFMSRLPHGPRVLDLCCGAGYDSVCLAGLVHLPAEKLRTAFARMGEVMQAGGSLLLTIRDGQGRIDKMSDVVVDGEEYDRSFYAQGRYILLDGHTRLCYAVRKGWESVRAMVESSDDVVYGFVEEAKKRNIHTPRDLTLVSHKEYEEKWDRFCDVFLAEAEAL